MGDGVSASRAVNASLIGCILNATATPDAPYGTVYICAHFAQDAKGPVWCRRRIRPLECARDGIGEIDDRVACLQIPYCWFPLKTLPATSAREVCCTVSPLRRLPLSVLPMIRAVEARITAIPSSPLFWTTFGLGTA